MEHEPDWRALLVELRDAFDDDPFDYIGMWSTLDNTYLEGEASAALLDRIDRALRGDPTSA